MTPRPGSTTSSSTGTTTSATPRPACAATRVERSASPVTCQTAARSTRPPSSGRPGSRLKPATRPLDSATIAASRYGSESSSNTGSAASPTPARISETSGPMTATAYSRAGVCGGSVISVTPARNVTVMLRTGRPKARATTQWPISCSSTETSISTAKAAAPT